jgi:hypothetical protein
MHITILSCGIFQPELDLIIPKIKRELQNIVITVLYLSPGLHNTPEKMKEELTRNLDNLKSEKTLTLYGSGCHTEIATMLKEYNTVSPKEKNCIEIVLNPEIKAEMDKSGNIIYLTAGWLKAYREVFWQNGYAGTIVGDKSIYLDCGENLISDEELLEFFDASNLPMEIETMSLDNFTDIVITLIKKLLD